MERYSSHKHTKVNVYPESDEDGEYIVLELSCLYPHGLEICLHEEIWDEIVEAGNELFNERKEDRRPQAFGGTLVNFLDHQRGVDYRRS